MVSFIKKRQKIPQRRLKPAHTIKTHPPKAVNNILARRDAAAVRIRLTVTPIESP